MGGYLRQNTLEITPVLTSDTLAGENILKHPVDNEIRIAPYRGGEVRIAL